MLTGGGTLAGSAVWYRVCCGLAGRSRPGAVAAKSSERSMGVTFSWNMGYTTAG